MTQAVSLDRLDAKIIGLLSANARMGILEIASALSVARNTVQARLRRLDESGVLRGFAPVLDLEAAGATVQAFAGLELEQGMLGKVVQGLATMPNVLAVHATTGREDLLVHVAATSHADLQDLIQSILSLPGVSRTNTSVVLTSPLTYRVQPLLEKMTLEAGWGRSTPLPPP